MPGFGDLLGESAALVGLRGELQRLVRRYANARRLPPVLLLGETGTGKSMIARALHAEGPRAPRPFVDVACPEIPATLMESEMFGVERGAFTDARQSRPGRFAEADRGTIFLDEIGLLPDVLQAKLLKVVEDQQLRALGATASKPIDVWIIAATSDDLEVAVRKRRFREDLYFRLAVVTLRVPPLRERGEDVVLLARHLLARACAEYGVPPKTFTPEAIATLLAHRWPGNVRELGNVIERVALRSEEPRVTAGALDLPDGSRKRRPAHGPVSAAVAPSWERRRLVFLRVTLISPAQEGDPTGLLEQARETIALFGGALDGMSPGGITAVFGLDLLEDAPQRAAHAAMAIRELGELSVAIHAAPTLLWKTDDDEHADAAARPEIWRTLDRLGAAADGIVVSAPTAAALGTTFHLVPTAGLEDGACLLLDGERPPYATASVFVGRREDMAMLQGRLALALGGRGQVVGIAGEAGIGKSRMLFEFRRTLPADAVRYVSARAQSHGRNVALLPIVELVRRTHGLDDRDSPAVVRDTLHASLAALGMALATAPYLLRLIGSDEGGAAIVHLGPQALHQRTLEIFREMVLAASRIRPLVLALEDLHWMDRASEGYLASLVDAIVEAPILLLTTFRTGYRPPWSERSYVSELRLQPLVRADARRVLDVARVRERDAAPLPPAIAEAILDRADGNPFFIEELARAVEPASVAPLAAIPESIEAVLLARIDRLAADSRSVLQAAAVLGRDVPVRLLEAITPEIGASGEHLRALQRLEYLHDGRRAPETYRFRHALTQEVAYASLQPARRRELHARVVAAVEAQHAGRLDEQTERLAHHARHAQLWPKALAYLQQAGRRATARAAHHEARACFDEALRALAQLPDDGSNLAAIDLRLDTFTCLLAVAEYRRCLTHLADAASLAEARGERRRLGQARAYQCIALRITGATDEAIEAGRQAGAIGKEIGDSELAATAIFFLGTAYATRGDLRQAESCYRASFGPLDGDLGPERAHALPRYEGAARAWLAWTLESLGEFDEAFVLTQEAIRIAQARGDRVHEASAFSLLGNVHLGLGEWALAIPLLERSLALCRSHDVHDWLGLVAMRLGFAYLHAGRLAEGLELLAESVAHAERIGQVTGAPARMAWLAHGYLLAGRHAESDEMVQRAATLAREYRQGPDEAECLRVMGAIAAAASPPQVESAAASFTRAYELALALGMRPFSAHCRLDLARLFLRAGLYGRAREHLAAAAATYEALNMRRWLEEAETDVRELDRRAARP